MKNISLLLNLASIVTSMDMFPIFVDPKKLAQGVVVNMIVKVALLQYINTVIVKVPMLLLIANHAHLIMRLLLKKLIIFYS